MWELNELAFREEGHIYGLNGIEIPSVSKIIEPVSKASYGGIDPLVLQRAADRGTAVHSAIDYYNTIGVMAVDDDFACYVGAYTKWCEYRKPKIIGSEIKLYHKVMRYGGTVDLLAEIDGELWLIDYKTSYKVVNKNYRLQLEAYSQALSTHGFRVDKKMVLHLKKNAEYEEIFYPTRDAEAWLVFGACKTVYDYNNKAEV